MITKYVSLSFDEADENFIEAFFKKMKIKVKQIKPAVEDDGYRPRTKEELKEDLREAIQEVNAARRGEIKLQNARAFLEEWNAEIETEREKFVKV